MQDRSQTRAAHEFWSMQDTVIAPLKTRPIPGKIYDFRRSWLEMRIVVFRAVPNVAAAAVKTT